MSAGRGGGGDVAPGTPLPSCPGCPSHPPALSPLVLVARPCRPSVPVGMLHLQLQEGSSPTAAALPG